MLRVMIVDDSAVARQVLARIMNDDPDVEVVAEAVDGAQAVDLAASVLPDIITMDINMPVMDGLEATRLIMERTPRPIVLISSRYDAREVQETFPVLEAGALTVLDKPGNPASPGFAAQADEVLRTIKNLARVKVVRRRRTRSDTVSPAPRPAPTGGGPRGTGRIDLLAVAASTGGPAALASILSSLPTELPVPVVVVQHIASGFDAGFAEWLDRVSRLRVRLAAHGDPLLPGEVLIGPHGRHLGVSPLGRASLSDEAPIGGHRPSATFLFRSVAQSYGARALGLILTGMGEDGAAGLVELKRAGGRVLAQDEASSVVYGMPKAAVQLGIVDWTLSLDDVAPTILGILRGASSRV